MKDLLRRWCLAATLLFVCAPIGASRPVELQEDAQQQAVSSASPRQAMEQFLGGMKAFTASGFVDSDALGQAANTFTVTPGAVDKDLNALAVQFYDVLNKTALIDLDEFPSAGDPALEVGVWTWVKRSPFEGVTVTLVFDAWGVAGSKQWGFSAETLARVSGWAETLKEHPPVSEYAEGLPLFDQLRWSLRNELPTSLRGRIFLLETWQWIGLLLLIIVGVIADRVITAIISKLAHRAAGRVSLDKEAVVNFQRPFGLLIVALTFLQLLPVLGLDPTQHRILAFAASFVIAVAGVWTAYRIVDVVCAYLKRKAEFSDNKFDDMLVPLLERTLKILVTVAGLVYLASQLSEDLYGIVAGLSIGSLAVGFAAKDSIENLFGTFTVLLDKPFELGDWITVGDIDGSVEQVGFRSTRVRTFYDSVITVPNSHFIGNEVDNHGARTYRRYTTTLGLTYDTPPSKIEAFCEGVRELIRRHPYTRKDSFHVYVKDFGANSVDVMLYCFVKTPDWGTELRERGRLILDILRLAESLGVEFAFPTRTVHMMGPQDIPGHDDAPSTVDEALSRGRDVAERLTPDGDVPPPVTYS